MADMISFLVAASLLGQTAPVRPNIIYIMADDLGYGELGCYGQKKIPTPNLDRLAASGMKFGRAYAASPVCAPTRYSLLTGKHQGNAAIRGNKERGAFGPTDPEGQTPLKKEETTIAEVLKTAGYRTALVGKWGLGSPLPGEGPNDHGFDDFYGYLCQRRAHNHYPVYLWKNRDPDLLGNPLFSAHQKITSPLSSEDEYYSKFTGPVFAGQRLMEESVRFVKLNAGKQPFFLYYAPTLPHVALQAPREWVDRFPKEWDDKPYLGERSYLPTQRPHATYAAMIAYLDHTVGEILKAVESTGQLENTLIIFTSDNGATTAGGAGQLFFQSNGNLRAGKMSLYEGGVRVPFLASWKGKIQPGTESKQTIVAYDAFATLASVAGVKAPKTDGISYLPALLGRTQPARPFTYFEYPEASAMQSILLGDMKVIRPDLKKNPDKVELYDLSKDPSESNNIAADHPKFVEEALQKMKALHKPNETFPLGVIDKKINVPASR